MGYNQNCEIWHGAYLGTLNMIHEESIWRTMWRPCFCHERAILWPFLEKGSTGYTQQFLIGYWSTLGTLIKIQEEPIWRTIWGPCFAKKGFWPFLEKGATGFIQQCKIVLGVSLGALIKIKHHVRTIFGWKRDSFWPFLGERAMEYL